MHCMEEMPLPTRPATTATATPARCYFGAAVAAVDVIATPPLSRSPTLSRSSICALCARRFNSPQVTRASDGVRLIRRQAAWAALALIYAASCLSRSHALERKNKQIQIRINKSAFMKFILFSR